jgi:hypothetical protein
MNAAQFTDWLKTTLGLIGGILATFGVGSSSTWATATGIAVSIAPFVWGLISNTTLAQVQKVAALEGVSAVVVRGTAPSALVNAAADPTQPKIKAFGAP